MTQINIRVDDEVKRDAEVTLDAIGLSMSTAINIFLKKVAREKRIPFELTAEPFYSDSNMRYLENIMRDVKEGKAKFAEHELKKYGCSISNIEELEDGHYRITLDDAEDEDHKSRITFASKQEN